MNLIETEWPERMARLHVVAVFKQILYLLITAVKHIRFSGNAASNGVQHDKNSLLTPSLRKRLTQLHLVICCLPLVSLTILR